MNVYLRFFFDSYAFVGGQTLRYLLFVFTAAIKQEDKIELEWIRFMKIIFIKHENI